MSETRTALIGRERELDRLFDRAQQACAGEGSVVILQGDAGIGKSALARAASRRGAELGMMTGSSRSDELTRTRPFGAVLDAVRPIVQHDPEWAALASRLRSVDQVDTFDALGTVGASLLQTVELAADAIERMATRQPLFVVADDLQWFDPATLATVTTLQRRIENLPLFIVLTWRTPDTERIPVVGSLVALGALAIELDRLDEASSEQLVGDLLGAPPAATTLSVLARAEGNPLYLTELAGAMRDRGLVVIRDGQAHADDVPLPPSLRMVLAARLARQPDDALAVLRTAAILGTSFSLDQLAIVTGHNFDQLVPMVITLVADGVLADADQGLTFRHPLLREVLYFDLPHELRRRLHLEVARALLASGASPADVAEHLLAGPLTVADDTLQLFVASGRALIDHRPTIAVRLLRRAVDAVPPSAQRSSWLADLIDALVADEDLDAVARLLEDAPPTDDPVLRSRMTVHRARLALAAGAFGDARSQLRTARQEPDLPPAIAARLAADDAIVGVLGEDASGLTSTRQAIALAEAAGDDATAALALGIEAYLTMLDAQCTTATRLAHQALDRFERVPSGRAAQLPHLFAGAVFTYTCAFDHALLVCDQGRRLAEENGRMLWAIPLFGVTASICHWRRGRLDDAETEAQAAIRAHDELGLRLGVSWAWTQIAGVRAMRGDQVAANAALSTAASTNDAIGSKTGLLHQAWVRAHLLEERDPAAALAVLVDAWTPVGEIPGFEVIAPSMTRLAKQLGERSTVAMLTAELDRLDRADPVDSDRAVIAWCRAIIDDDPTAILQQVKVFEASERLLDAATARQHAGELFVTAGCVANAVVALGASSEAFELVGATHRAARVGQLADRLGRRTRRRPPRPLTGWGALTNTELEVVQHAVDGLSNPDIGRRMFISRRTVETHLSHVYTKLGIGSRVELVNAYRRQDIGTE